MEQAFKKTAEMIYEKVKNGEIDITNESEGVKSGQTQSVPGVRNLESRAEEKKGGCC